MDKSILIVDDSIITRQIVRRILKNLGYTDVIEASNGAEAYERVTGPGAEIGLILLDWNMPHMTGIELLGLLREHPKASRIPVVMISAESAPERVLEAVRAGAKSYVIKPFHPKELKVKINEALRLADLDRRRSALSGSLSDVGVPALVQLATTSGLSGSIVVCGADREVVGVLGVGGGEVRHCRYAGATGDEAFLKLALRREGTFEFRPGDDAPGDRNIHSPPTLLIMEALRRQDEALRAS